MTTTETLPQIRENLTAIYGHGFAVIEVKEDGALRSGSSYTTLQKAMNSLPGWEHSYPYRRFFVTRH